MQEEWYYILWKVQAFMAILVPSKTMLAALKLKSPSFLRLPCTLNKQFIQYTPAVNHEEMGTKTRLL
jgi:hypothetical protein